MLTKRDVHIDEGKIAQERDEWRRKEAEARRQLDQGLSQQQEAQELQSQLARSAHEKRCAVEELHEYEEVLEK